MAKKTQVEKVIGIGDKVVTIYGAATVTGFTKNNRVVLSTKAEVTLDEIVEINGKPIGNES